MRIQAQIRGVAGRLPVRGGCKEKGPPTARRRLAMVLVMAALAVVTGLAPVSAQTSSPDPAPQTMVQAAVSDQRPFTFDERNEGEAPAQRNPFAPSRRSVAMAGAGAGPRTQFRTNNASARLPRLKLKGLVQAYGGAEVTALLEVDKVGVYVVHKGDIIGLPNGGSDSVIKVNEITALSILVEVGSLGQLIIVR
jgi:hypothetical protein